MNLADLSIRRPIFITCIVIVMLALGLQSLSKLGVDHEPSSRFSPKAAPSTHSTTAFGSDKMAHTACGVDVTSIRSSTEIIIP